MKKIDVITIFPDMIADYHRQHQRWSQIMLHKGDVIGSMPQAHDAILSELQSILSARFNARQGRTTVSHLQRKRNGALPKAAVVTGIDDAIHQTRAQGVSCPDRRA